MSRSEPQQILADLQRLSRDPERLAELGPLLRTNVQSTGRDLLRAQRTGNLIAAEDWRRCLVAAGDLLQRAEEATA